MKHIILLLFLLFFSACFKTNTDNNTISIDNKTISADNNSIQEDNQAPVIMVDNKINDNSSDYNTIVNVSLDENGETITEVYIEKNTNKNNNYADIINLVKKHNDKLCNDTIINSLENYSIDSIMEGKIVSIKGYTITSPSILHIAVICEYSDVVQMIIEKGVNVELVSDDFIYVEDLAKEINNKEIIEMIFNAKETRLKEHNN